MSPSVLSFVSETFYSFCRRHVQSYSGTGERRNVNLGSIACLFPGSPLHHECPHVLASFKQHSAFLSDDFLRYKPLIPRQDEVDCRRLTSKFTMRAHFQGFFQFLGCAADAENVSAGCPPIQNQQYDEDSYTSTAFHSTV